MSALAETPVGLGLMISPALVSQLLLGASLDTPAALVVGRISGAALLSLSLACWMAHRDTQSRAGMSVILGMTVYNCATIATLAFAGATGLAGLLLWPAVGVHVILAAWCLACAVSVFP